jgi:hypothetical protein
MHPSSFRPSLSIPKAFHVWDLHVCSHYSKEAIFATLNLKERNKIYEGSQETYFRTAFISLIGCIVIDLSSHTLFTNYSDNPFWKESTDKRVENGKKAISPRNMIILLCVLFTYCLKWIHLLNSTTIHSLVRFQSTASHKSQILMRRTAITTPFAQARRPSSLATIVVVVVSRSLACAPRAFSLALSWCHCHRRLPPPVAHTARWNRCSFWMKKRRSIP